MKKLLFVMLCCPLFVEAGGFNRDTGNRPYYRGDRQENTPPKHRSGSSSAMPNGARSDTITTNSTGVVVTTNGFERIAGTDIPITVKSEYTRGAISAAAVAASMLCGSNPLTAIICGAAISYGLDKGIEKCEEFGWCKPNNPVASADGGNIWSAPGASGTGSYVCANSTAINHTYNFVFVQTASRTAKCVYNTSSVNLMFVSCAPDFSGNPCVYTGPPKPKIQSPPPWVDPGFPPYLDTRQGNEPNFGPDIGSEATGSGHAPESTTAGGPTVTAEPTIGHLPEITTSSTPRADGSVDTTTTTTTPTVTPTVTNNNTTSPKITYQSSTNTTTSTTNNVSNNTTVSSSTQTKAEPTPMELPDDYNREATQQQIADELSAVKAPAAPADQAVRTTTELAKTDTGLAEKFTAITAAFVPDKANWFSWVWTPPLGVCNDAQFAGVVHGYSVGFSICEWVGKIRDVLGWLFALFAAMMIYGQIFKKSE